MGLKKLFKKRGGSGTTQEKEKESHGTREEKELSTPRKVFRIIKNTICITVIVILSFMLISFLIVRVSGGTPNVFGYSIQRVVSGSMEPELQVGEIILSKTVDNPDEVTQGDIITFKGGESFGFNNVTHRVVVTPHMVDNGEYMLMTKGDANDNVDPEINFSAVQSKFISKLDLLKAFFEFFLSPWGLIIFIGALLLVFFDELINLIRIATGSYPEEDEESISDIIERIQREDREREEEKERLSRKKSRDMANLMSYRAIEDDAEPSDGAGESKDDRREE